MSVVDSGLYIYIHIYIVSKVQNMEQYFSGSHLSPDVLCLHCVSEETQPLRPDSPGLVWQDLTNKNTGYLVISEFYIKMNNVFSVQPMQYFILDWFPVPPVLLGDFESYLISQTLISTFATWGE